MDLVCFFIFDNKHILGVAILSSPIMPEKTTKSSPTNSEAPSPVNNGPKLTPRQQHANNTKSKIEKLMKDLEEQEQSTIVKLGDASIAAPFTSKYSSIQCSKYFFFVYELKELKAFKYSFSNFYFLCYYSLSRHQTRSLYFSDHTSDV